MTRSRRVRAVWVTLALGVSMVLGGLLPAQTSSHREAPLITEDPVADNTDVYAFMSPEAPGTVTIISNWVPLEEPAGGPNFHRFGDDVLYEINIDTNGDATEDIDYEFRFKTTVANGDSFLYNTDSITSLGDPDLNVRQTYTVTRASQGVRTVLGSNLATAPANIGPRSTPDYETNLAEAAIHGLSDGTKVFAGPRDEGFYVDLGSVFDLLGLRPFNPAHVIPLAADSGVDGTSGYNVHTIAIQVPVEQIIAPGEPVIGVFSTTYRRKVRVLRENAGKPDRHRAPVSHNGPWVQVSRLGMPLVNEVVIPLGRKDRFNASEPEDDGQFLPFVHDPEPARLMPVLYPGVFSCFPSTPRDDLVAIFLTGIAGLNQPAGVVPSEMIRLNTSIAPSASPNPLGAIAGDVAGFPNGRRVFDDVVDIELRALAGGTPIQACDQAPNNLLGDGVGPGSAPEYGNDVAYRTTFPYLGAPHQGYSHAHDHQGS